MGNGIEWGVLGSGWRSFLVTVVLPWGVTLSAATGRRIDLIGRSREIPGPQSRAFEFVGGAKKESATPPGGVVQRST